MDSAHLDVLIVGAVLCELSLCAALHGEDGLCQHSESEKRGQRMRKYYVSNAPGWLGSVLVLLSPFVTSVAELVVCARPRRRCRRRPQQLWTLVHHPQKRQKRPMPPTM